MPERRSFAFYLKETPQRWLGGLTVGLSRQDGRDGETFQEILD